MGTAKYKVSIFCDDLIQQLILTICTDDFLPFHASFPFQEGFIFQRCCIPFSFFPSILLKKGSMSKIISFWLTVPLFCENCVSFSVEL